MDNFDLKKYLAEGRLLKENKMLDIYQDGDVVVDISAATPNQERLIQWETEISDFNDSEEAQEIVDQIMQLNSEDQVYDYYAYERDWKRDSDLKREIRNAIAIFKGEDELN
jgi:antirestriction protein